jgi:hypothetical protein
MGIKKFYSVADAMVRSLKLSRSADSIVSAVAGVDVCAIDANSMLYWAYGSLLSSPAVSKTADDKYQTNLKYADILTKIQDLFMLCLRNVVEKLEPKVLVIALDGVPPAAKIMDQRARRIEGLPTDLYGQNNQLVFTTSWICPNSELLMLVDRAISASDISGSMGTIYSGPGVCGESPRHRTARLLRIEPRADRRDPRRP